jgi:hypothetical protein
MIQRELSDKSDSIAKFEKDVQQRGGQINNILKESSEKEFTVTRLKTSYQ